MDSPSSTNAPPNPLATANIFSYVSFSWVSPFFTKRGQLTIDDLWSLLPEDTSANLSLQLTNEWKKELQRHQQHSSSSSPSLFRAYLRAFGPRYFIASLWIIIKAVFVLAQTQFLGLLIESLRTDESVNVHQDQTYLYALGLILTTISGGLLHHFFFFRAWRQGMQWRAASLTILYEKSLRVRLDALNKITAGKVINIASNDIERFQKLAQMGVYIFLSPIEGVIIIWLLYREVGYGAFAGILVLIFLVTIQSFFSRIFGRLRSSTAAITDNRVRTTGQIINGIRAVKSYGWEPAFAKRISEIRKQEISVITYGAWLRGLNEGIFTASLVLVGAATFLTAYALDYTLSPRNVFITLSLFSFLQVELTKFFPMGLEGLAEVRVSIQRIQSILEMDEVTTELLIRDKTGTDKDGNGSNSSSTDEETGTASSSLPIIKVQNLTCSWGQTNPTNASPSASASATSASDLSSTKSSSHHHTLEHINLEVYRQQLCAIVGPVGAGKSSLLMAILGELVPTKKEEVTSTNDRNQTVSSSATVLPTQVKVQGRIAYVSQNPWIITASVRDNIVFGLPFNPQLYDQVIHYCNLEEDLKNLQHGDETIVGERGINLSGGQRARLGLARACYLNADIYLLDDPLSAVDAKVGRILFEACICGFLRHKTRVLVTHQLQYIKSADNVLILDKGSIIMQGTFDHLSSVYSEILKNPSTVSLSTQGTDMTALMELFTSDKHAPSSLPQSPLLVGTPVDILPNGTTTVLELDSKNDNGSPSENIDNDAHGDTVNLPMDVNGSPSAAADAATTSPTVVVKDRSVDAKVQGLVQAETMEQGGVKGEVFVRYWTGAGGLKAIIPLFTLLGGATVAIILAGVYLAVWVGSPTEEQGNVTLVATYGGIVGAAFLLSLARAVSFFVASVLSSRRLHDEAFTHVLRAPVLFFDSNPAGRILNRLSKDIGLMDDFLPLTAFDFFSTLLLCIATVILVCAVAYWIIAASVPLAVVFYYLRRYYMLTSRSLKRIEAVSRSPVYSLMGECLNGLPVIRAFGLGPLLVEKFRNASDNNIRAYFVFIATSRWLGVRLDALCFLLLIATAFASAALRGTLPPALVGLSLTYIMAITNAFQWMVRQSSEYENSMVSVERVLEYTTLPIEEVDIEGKDPSTLENDVWIPVKMKENKHTVDDLSYTNPLHSANDQGNPPYRTNPSPSSSSSLIDLPPIPSAWPLTGKLTFTNVWMKYRTNLDPVLRGVTATIPAGTRVGVVGRTGAGKSSLFSVILRLVEPERDNHGLCGLAIDDIDIARIHLTRLRRAISVIPQDPVLFQGTVRDNLDPFREHTDDDCIDALQRVQLYDYLVQKQGLEHFIEENGNNLSIGQRQLICLARAVLRKNKLLLMDECSANVDMDTDTKIQNTVRHAFVSSTIITIAHRLATVIDYDYIMVMSNGKVTEWGSPSELLRKGTESPFYQLVKETKQMTLLTKLANEAEQKRLSERKKTD